MNKTAIKNFAIWARVQLIEAAKQKAFEYEITENGENKVDIDSIGDRLLTKDEKEQRRQLISQIHQKGFTQVMEEAAYTWFNRFVALRFMEVNGYLPSKVRVFTDENGLFKPEIMKQAMTVEIDGLDRSRVLTLLDAQANEELYKYLLITQCNALNAGLPYMFEKIANPTELLFPANLLRPDSVLGQMVDAIPEEDWKDAVQIIGWLYQYYNTELKDDTFAQLKKNVKITKERIPAATQLFTPDWIVRYMVENSLGRLWLEGHPNAELHDGWKYYLDEAEQEPEVEAQLSKLREEYKNIKPEEIKIIDPCMGSGHILVYAFDVLMQIYTSAGWSERDAAKSIIENNLFGLDIDDRAGQLAYFAIMMKARKHNRRILNGGIAPNVLAIQESGWMTDDFIAYVANGSVNLKADLVILRNTFKEAKEYGSILNVPMLNFDALLERIDAIEKNDTENLFHIQYRDMTAELLAPLVKQAKIMAQKYDVVVTNPPYMAVSNAGAKVNDYVKRNFPDSKADLFAVFIERCGQIARHAGIISMITQQSFFFLSGLETLRRKFEDISIFINAIHMGIGAFGTDFGTVAFVALNSNLSEYIGEYIYLGDEKSADEKEKLFISGYAPKYLHSITDFSVLPNNTYSYMITPKTLTHFKDEPLSHCFVSGGRNKTHNDEKYLRLHWEISDFSSKWVPYGKGGEFRRWYGNEYYVVDWSESARNAYAAHGGLCNPKFWGHTGITWSIVTSYKPSFRYKQENMIYSSVSPTIFRNDFMFDYFIIALLNSNVGGHFLNIISSTIGTNVGEVLNFPVLKKSEDEVEQISEQNIKMSRYDWDSYEISRDFKRNPLV